MRAPRSGACGPSLGPLWVGVHLPVWGPPRARRQLWFRAPRLALPTEQPRPGCGSPGARLGRLSRGCDASPLPAEPGSSTKRHAVNRSHGPPSGITRHSGCPAGQSRRVSSPTLSWSVAPSCCWPACAAAGRPHRHPLRVRVPVVPMFQGRLPSSCRPQRVRSPRPGRLARVARGSEGSLRGGGTGVVVRSGERGATFSGGTLGLVGSCLPPSVPGWLPEALQRERTLQRGRQQAGGRVVPVPPRLPGRHVLRLHGRLLQLPEERDAQRLHRYGGCAGLQPAGLGAHRSGCLPGLWARTGARWLSPAPPELGGPWGPRGRPQQREQVRDGLTCCL